MIKAVWNCVPKKSIRNCFTHAGLCINARFEPEDDLNSSTTKLLIGKETKPKNMFLLDILGMYYI